MADPAAGGRRFPIGDRTMFLSEIADIARAAAPERAAKVPRRTMPDWLVRIYALFDADVRGNTGELGTLKRLDSRDTIALLDHPLIPGREAIAESVRSLIAQKLI
jgi:dihydroflavonol-4-reductase